VDSNDFQSPLPSRLSTSPDLTPPPAPVTPPVEEAPLTSTPTPPPKNPKNPKYLLFAGIAILFALIILAVFKLLIPALKGQGAAAVTLNYWGLWEDSSVMASLISEFETKNPGIKINYKQNDKTDYRSRLAGRLAKDPDTEEVPDIFRIHSSWLPMFKGELAPVPTTTATNLNLDGDFYAVYQKDLKTGTSYYAVPLMYDGLVLFYNKDLIQKAGVELPKSWWDLQSTAAKLTVRDDQGNIQVAGVAMGLTDNVDQWGDILGLLLKQNGADLTKNTVDNDTKIKDVLSYYTNFKTQYKTWDETLPSSTQLFAQGKLAFYFGPSWRIFNIEDLNPSLSFDITSVPQLPTLSSGTNSSPSTTADLTNIHWATYWAEAVNLKSKHQKEAWKFIEFLASKDSLEKMYTAASQVRSFGEIYPRISLGDKLKTNSRLKVFVNTAPNASSGYLTSNTQDSGLNTELSKYFSDAINGMLLNNADTTTIMTNLKNGITQIVQKYNLK